MRFAHWFTVDRHGLSALAMTRWERNGGVQFGSNTIFVIARKERSERRGNPLGAMVAYGECGTLPDSQWIATGCHLAMTIHRYSVKGDIPPPPSKMQRF
jgi:hypothetical protein